jgi:hypothetical protein
MTPKRPNLICIFEAPGVYNLLVASADAVVDEKHGLEEMPLTIPALSG